MDRFSSKLSQSVRETLGEWISKESERLALSPASDYAAYRERVGKIKGFQESLALIERIETELGRPEDTAPKPVEKQRYES